MARPSDSFIDDRVPANANRDTGARAAARGMTGPDGAATRRSGGG